jgi:siderophore synthetase component
VVHAAVVLVPLAALALIALCWKADWRRQYAFPIAVLALGGAAAAILAAATGGNLEATIRDAAGTRVRFGEHPEQGDTARLFAVLFAMGATGLWVLETWRERLKLQSWTSTAAYAASSVIGVIAILTMVVAGHSGAALVWKDVGNFVNTNR